MQTFKMHRGRWVFRHLQPLLHASHAFKLRPTARSLSQLVPTGQLHLQVPDATDATDRSIESSVQHSSASLLQQKLVQANLFTRQLIVGATSAGSSVQQIYLD